jgi:hypothetical protein
MLDIAPSSGISMSTNFFLAKRVSKLFFAKDDSKESLRKVKCIHD